MYKKEFKTKEEKLNEVYEKIQENINKADLSTLIETMKRFSSHKYSKFNYFNAMCQFISFYPDKQLTQLGSVEYFKSIGRRIKLEDYKYKKLWILAPAMSSYEKENEKGEKETISYVKYFKSVPIYEINQTEIVDQELADQTKLYKADSLPDIDQLLNDTVEKAEKAGYKVSFQSMGFNQGGCINANKEIYINNEREKELQLSTIFHELAHYNLDHLTSRHGVDHTIKETEAEFLSCVLCSFHGINSDKHELYLKGYLKDNKLGDFINIRRILESLEKIEKILE